MTYLEEIVTDARGSFAIADLPPGRNRLFEGHPERPGAESSTWVTLTPDKPVFVELRFHPPK